MKLILHIGMPKTGTSTLQQALSSHSRALHEVGILYPETSGKRTNHNPLSCALLPAERIHREFRTPGRSYESIRAFGDEFWADIRRQVSRSRATTTVLSSEYLFHFRDEDVQALRELLRPVFDEVEIAAYVRHPAEYFLSMAQQKVKASADVRAPSTFRARYEQCINRYVDAFDGRVSVRAYERESLAGGSIVQDFAGHFLPAIPIAPFELDIGEMNTSMSGEAMCIMQTLRRYAWPDKNDVFMPESQHVMAVLKDIGREIGQSAPRLKPSIDAGLTARHRAEINWLRSEFGVEFHHATGPGTRDPDEAAWASTDLVEILDVDRISIDRTTALLQKELAAAAIAAARADRRRGSSGSVAAPRFPRRADSR